MAAVIPARWGSTRFPGKVLAPIAGEPMIVHVIRRVMRARRIDEVLVATDDERVAGVAAAAGATVVVTGECRSGTDRVAEAVAGRDDLHVIVNVQGDEPLISGDNVDAVVEGLVSVDGIGMATLCRPLEPERADDPNAVKVVRDVNFRALYFSRAAVPYPRDRDLAAPLWRLHLGIYGFQRDTLRRFVGLPPSPLEQAEALEQLRALEHGIAILVLDAPDPACGVDTPEDLERVEALINRRN